ncbi:lonely Cys domain-containing protein, partial [Streptomyces sp. NPDC051639]|uniref:lonely Cys domain-containing protein n=1 Tax=Streptomyces sp. NPDC051639 TaxID=3155671 RepID=UPI0034424623
LVRSSTDWQSLRDDFLADHTPPREVLSDGRVVRTLPVDPARPGLRGLDARLDARVAELEGRWEGRLGAKAAEDVLIAEARREQSHSYEEFGRRTAREVTEEFPVRDLHTKVLDDHLADFRAQGTELLDGRSPRDLSREDWDAHITDLADLHVTLMKQMPARYDLHVGLDRAAREADEAAIVGVHQPDRAAYDAEVARVRADFRSAMTKAYRRHVGMPEEGLFSARDLAAREETFTRESFDPYAGSLVDRVLYEADLARVLKDGADEFHTLSAATEREAGASGRRHDMSEGTFKTVSDAFRDDLARLHHMVHGPADRDLAGWLKREREDGDVFRGRLRESEDRARAEAGTSRSAVDVEAWRSRLTEVFREMHRRTRTSEYIQRELRERAESLHDPRARSYVRDASDIDGLFLQEFRQAGSEAARDVAVARAGLRLRWLTDSARHQDEAYRWWESNPLAGPHPRLDLPLPPWRRSEAPASERWTTAAPGPQGQVSAGLGSADAGAATGPAPDLAAEPAATAVSAPAERLRQALAGLRPKMEQRAQAYREFQRHLAGRPDHDMLSGGLWSGPVAKVRDWFADQWTGTQRPVGSEELEAALQQRLDGASAVLRSSDLFHREVEPAGSTHAAPDFAYGEAARTLRERFAEEISRLPLSPDARTGTATPGAVDALVKRYRESYAQAAEAFRQAGARQQLEQRANDAFDEVLRVRTPQRGLVNLADPYAHGHGAASWYSRQINRQVEEMRQRYVGDYVNARTAPDGSEALIRLNTETRTRARTLAERAATTHGLSRRIDAWAENHPAGGWSRRLTRWYERERWRIADAFADGLFELAPESRPGAEAALVRRLDVLYRVARDRHAAEQEFDRVLADDGISPVDLTSQLAAAWADGRIRRLREEHVHAYLEQRADRYGEQWPAETPVSAPRVTGPEDDLIEAVPPAVLPVDEEARVGGERADRGWDPDVLAAVRRVLDREGHSDVSVDQETVARWHERLPWHWLGPVPRPVADRAARIAQLAVNAASPHPGLLGGVPRNPYRALVEEHLGVDGRAATEEQLTPEGRDGLEGHVGHEGAEAATDLDALARAAGLHRGEGRADAWATSRVRQYIRTLGETFGTGIDATPGYRDLLRGLHSVDLQRWNTRPDGRAAHTDGRMSARLLRAITQDVLELPEGTVQAPEHWTRVLDEAAIADERARQARTEDLGPVMSGALPADEDDVVAGTDDVLAGTGDGFVGTEDGIVGTDDAHSHTPASLEPRLAQEDGDAPGTVEPGERRVHFEDGSVPVRPDRPSFTQSPYSTVETSLNIHRRPEIDRAMVPPPPFGREVAFEDGSRMPAYITGDGTESGTVGTYGAALVRLRGVQQVADEIITRAGLAGPAAKDRAVERAEALDDLRRALRDTPWVFHGDGYRGPTFLDDRGWRRHFRVITRPHNDWERFTDGYGTPFKFDAAQRSQVNTGASVRQRNTFRIAPAASLGPAGSIASYARVGVGFGYGRTYDYAMQNQTLSQVETRMGGSSHLYLDDAQYEVRLEGYPFGRKGWERLVPGESHFTFGVRHGLSVRLPESETNPGPADRMPKEMDVDPDTSYRLAHTEGFGPVGAIRDWALERLGGWHARPGTSAYAEVSSFFTTENFHRMAGRLTRGPITSRQLAADEGRKKPLGVFVVDRVVPGRATLLTETTAAEIRATIQATIKDERTLLKTYSQDLTGIVGPSSDFPDLFGVSAGLRAVAGWMFRYGRSTEHGSTFGGTGGRKTVARVKAVPTGLYLVRKTVHVRMTGDREATPFETWSLDRLTETEARRLAGWSDGTALASRLANEPFAPAYLTRDDPSVLGMSRVEAFLPDDTDDRSVPHVENFTAVVLRAAAAKFPGMVAPLEDFGDVEDSRWRGSEHYRMALQNTLRIIDTLPDLGDAEALQTLTTTGLPIELVVPGRLHRSHRLVWIVGRLTGRRYEGTQNDMSVRTGSPGTDRFDGAQNVVRGLESGLVARLQVRDAVHDQLGGPRNLGMLQAGPRWGTQRGRRTSYGSIASFESLSMSTAPSHLYSYRLELSARTGGFRRFRQLVRGTLSLGLLATRFFVSLEPEEELPGARAAGRVLLSVPSEHAPLSDPHIEELHGPRHTEADLTPAEAGALVRGEVTDAAAHEGSPFGNLPYHVVSVGAHRELVDGVERVMNQVSNGNWQFTQKGAPAHTAMTRPFRSAYLAAGFDQTSGPAGILTNGLFALGPYLNRLGALVHRAGVENLRVASDPVRIEAWHALGSDTTASGGHSVTHAFTVAVAGYAGHTHDTGPTVEGRYGFAGSIGRSSTVTKTVSRTVTSDLNPVDASHKVVLIGDSRHEIAGTVRGDGIFAPLHTLATWDRDHWAGKRFTFRSDWVGHIAEKVAHRLGLIQDRMGEVPLYTAQPWRQPQWLRDNLFGSYPVGDLDARQVLSEFDAILRGLGADDASRERVRSLGTLRALRALRDQMTSGGAASRARVGRYGWGRVRVLGRSLEYRAELIAAEPVFDGLGHGTVITDGRHASETVETVGSVVHTKAVGPTVADLTRTGDATANAAGPSYAEQGSTSQQALTGDSHTRLRNTLFATEEPHAEYLTRYRMRLTLTLHDGSTLTAEGPVGELRDQVPLSLSEPAPPASAPVAHDRLRTPAVAAPPAYAQVWNPVDVTEPNIERWRATAHPDGVSRPFIMPETGFHVRQVVGLDNVRTSADLGVATAYGTRLGTAVASGAGLRADDLATAVRKAHETGLTRLGTVSSLALHDGTTAASLSAFFSDTAEPAGYQVAGLFEDTFVGGAEGGYRLYSRPDLGAATLLTVAPSTAMESVERSTRGHGSSVARGGGQQPVFGGGPGVVTNEDAGRALPGLQNADVGTSETDTRRQDGTEANQVTVKPAAGRAFLFAIPTAWLGVADVHRTIKDSRFGQWVRKGLGPFGLAPGPQAVETGTQIIAWVREDVARELGLVTDENFPESVADGWNKVKDAADAWVAADEAYWTARRAVPALRAAQQAAKAELRDAKQALSRALRGGGATAVTQARARVKDAAGAVVETRRAQHTARTALGSKLTDSESAAVELHRVRTEADRLTRYHRLPADQRQGVAEPPQVSWTPAPVEATAADTAERWTSAPGADDGPTVLTSPDGTRYTVFDVPRDGDAFYRAIAEGLLHEVHDRQAPDVPGDDPGEAGRAVRALLADALEEPANADLLAFAAPDTHDVFSAQELADSGVRYPEGSPEQREFEATGYFPLHDAQPDAVRAALAAAQVRRPGDADGDTGWNHGAADVLPALAARAFGVKVTVVRDDGSFHAYVPSGAGAGEGLPHVVLHLADQHFQAALADTARPDKGKGRATDIPAPPTRPAPPVPATDTEPVSVADVAETSQDWRSEAVEPPRDRQPDVAGQEVLPQPPPAPEPNDLLRPADRQRPETEGDSGEEQSSTHTPQPPESSEGPSPWLRRLDELVRHLLRDGESGEPVLHKRIKDEELYTLDESRYQEPGQAVFLTPEKRIRINPLAYPMADIRPAKLTENRNAVWLYAVSEETGVVFGSEKVTDVLTPEEFQQLLAGMRRKNPDLTAEELTAGLDGLGHTGLAMLFDAEHAHVTTPGRVRLAGEFRWSAERGTWVVNDQSGRYMSEKVRPGLDPVEAGRWLANFARVMSHFTGEDVATQQLKTAVRSAPVSSAPGEPVVDIRSATVTAAVQPSEDRRPDAAQEAVPLPAPEPEETRPIREHQRPEPEGQLVGERRLANFQPPVADGSQRGARGTDAPGRTIDGGDLTTVRTAPAEPSSSAVEAVPVQGVEPTLGDTRVRVPEESSVRGDAPVAAGDADGHAHLSRPEALEAAARAVADRLARGESAVPYMVREATDGMADPARGGLQFGVEIEFELPVDLTSQERTERLHTILDGLREAGLTSQERMGEYHEAGEHGYRSWFLEKDPSLEGGAELVSPKLSDTEETWTALRAALRVIRARGGVITARTGGHVNVSTAQFAGDVLKYEALRALFTGHQDALFRWATDPAAGGHRGTKHALPLGERAWGSHVGLSSLYSGQRKDALNFDHVSGTAEDHVEFRLWDGSLDEAEIQTRVKLSLGLVDAAGRLTADRVRALPGYEEVGTHAAVAQDVLRARDDVGTPTVFAPDAAEHTARARALLDTIFRRQEDVDQALSLLSTTPWFGRRETRPVDAEATGHLDTARVEGLAPLRDLGALFVKRLPGAAVFRKTAAVSGRGETGTVARLREALAQSAESRSQETPEQGDAFVALVELARHARQYRPHAYGFGGSRYLEVAEAATLLSALGWTPGMPLVVAEPVDDTRAGLVAWASELATELRQPVYVPATATGGEEVELPGSVLETPGIEAFGPSGPLTGHGDSPLDPGELLTVPDDTWFKLVPQGVPAGESERATPAGQEQAAEAGPALPLRLEPDPSAVSQFAAPFPAPVPAAQPTAAPMPADPAETAADEGPRTHDSAKADDEPRTHDSAMAGAGQWTGGDPLAPESGQEGSDRRAEVRERILREELGDLIADRTRLTLARLDDLRQADTRLRGTDLDLNVLARRVLLMDDHAAISPEQRALLFRLMDEVGPQARLLAELSARHLVNLGVLAPNRLLSNRQGVYGVNWTDRNVPDIDLTTIGDAVEVHGTVFRLSVRWAPWYQGGTPPYVVMAEGHHSHVRIPDSTGTVHRAPSDVVGELLKYATGLAGATQASLLLLVPGSGAGTVKLPRRVADLLGRRTWSTNGDISYTQDPGQPLSLSTPMRRDVQKSVWIPSDPGLSEETLDGAVAESWWDEVLSTTLVTDDGARMVGRISFPPHELIRLSHSAAWASSDILKAHTPTLTAAERLLQFPGPLNPDYNLTAHGAPGLIYFGMTDGSLRDTSGPAAARWIARRPSLNALPASVAISLDACYGASARGTVRPGPLSRTTPPFVADPLHDDHQPVAQHVANETGRRVRAGTTIMGHKQTSRVIFSDHRGRHGAVREFMPEPAGADLAERARVAGLFTRSEFLTEALRSRALRLVRALRLAFGPDVDSDPAYPELLKALGSLDRMWDTDPRLRRFGPFTMDLFDHAAETLKASLPGPWTGRPGPDDHRELLAWVARTVASGDPGDLSQLLPLLGRSAERLLRAADLDAETVEILRRAPGPDEAETTVVGDAERSRAFWATAKALFWEARATDLPTLGARILHVDQLGPEHRDELLETVTRAAADGRDLDDVEQLAAFHLELLGAFDRWTALRGDGNQIVGRNWAQPGGDVRIRTTGIDVLETQPEGGTPVIGTRKAAWEDDDSNTPFFVWAAGGPDHVLLRLPRGTYRIPFAELGELLTWDPSLSSYALESAFVVLVVPGAAGRMRSGGEAGPRPADFIPERTGRVVWASPRHATLGGHDTDPGAIRPVTLGPGDGTATDDWIVSRPSLPGTPAPVDAFSPSSSEGSSTVTAGTPRARQDTPVTSAPAQHTSRDQVGQVPGAVIQRLASGRPALPYRLGDVTDGAADPARGGMAFQIAVDFQARDSLNEQEVVRGLSTVLGELRVQGLSRQVFPQYGVSSGWQITPPNDLETLQLISPWLRDTEHDWHGLRTALSLMRESGDFLPAPWGSARVRVGVPNRLSQTEERVLADVVRGHQDVLFRLAADPVTGDGPRHVRALPAPALANGPADGLLPADPLMAVHPAEPGSPSIDFALWTASFDEGLLQARVLLSLGLVSGAKRLAQEPSWRAPLPEPPGTHAGVIQNRASAPGAQAVYRLDDPRETARLGSLLNASVPRPYDRAVVSALFAMTRWFGATDEQGRDLDASLVPYGVPGLEDLVPLGRIFLAPTPGGLVFFDRDELNGPEEAEIARAARESFGRSDAFVLRPMRVTETPPSRPLADSAAGPRVVSPEQMRALLLWAGWSAEQPLVIPYFESAAWSEWEWPLGLSSALGRPVFLDVGGYGMPAGALRRADVFVSSDRFPTDLPSLTSGEDEVELPSGSWLRVAAEGVAVEDGPFSWPA